MKGLVLGSVALIAISVSIPAHAADMAVKAPAPTVSVAPYNWSGLYVGGNFGGAWTSGNLNIPGNNFYGSLTEFIGGVRAGPVADIAGRWRVPAYGAQAGASAQTAQH